MGRHRSENFMTAAQVLPVARIIGLLAALCAGLALCLGSYLDIVASDGPANFILPFTIAIVVAGGLGAGWHVALGMGAQAQGQQAKIIAILIGLALAVIGTATSAWFLAAKIGGSPAIQMHQSAYLRDLQEAEQVVAKNANTELELLNATETLANGLNADAESEGKFGMFSGKSGYKGVYEALISSAQALIGIHTDLRKLDSKRQNLLTAARRDIELASRAIADRDREAFEQAASRAATEIADASRIRISGLAGNLTLGSATGAAGRAIASTATSVGDVARDVESRLDPVTIPTFAPMDAKEAVVAYPAPLPWIMAILIEALPLIMLGLLIVLPRGHDAPEPISTDLPQRRRRSYHSVGHSSGHHSGRD